MDPNLTPEYRNHFEKVISTLHPVSEHDFAIMENLLHVTTFKKGDIIFSEGEVCRFFCFILKGSFRIYSLEDGLEINVSFFFENSLAGDFISLSHNAPSEFFMEAMEECTTLVAYKKEYKPALKFSKFFVELTSNFFQRKYFSELQHSNSFKLLKPEERYKHLLKQNPKYIQRIPVIHLASYLGMSRKTLTRIRSKMA